MKDFILHLQLRSSLFFKVFGQLAGIMLNDTDTAFLMRQNLNSCGSSISSISRQLLG